MREILFRGKRTDNGKWWFGFYLFLHVCERDWTGEKRGWAKDVHFIVDETDLNYAVDPETVGQYTGFTDKNGTKIFEGDIIKSDAYTFVVRYGKCGGVANNSNYGYIGFYLEGADALTKGQITLGLRDDIMFIFLMMLKLSATYTTIQS